MTASLGYEILDRIVAPRIEVRGGYPTLADVALQNRPRLLWANLFSHE
jgi:hypothetical protein